jgi:hypothetical protein
MTLAHAGEFLVEIISQLFYADILVTEQAEDPPPDPPRRSACSSLVAPIEPWIPSPFRQRKRRARCVRSEGRPYSAAVTTTDADRSP